jgi:predicted transcriptional regulator
MQGMTVRQIAAERGIAYDTLKSYIYKATKAGELVHDSIADRLEYEIIPKVVDNVNTFLDEKSEKMTIEAAKGLGVFKSYQAVKVENATPSMVLAIKFENSDVQVAPADEEILGQPKLPDIEIEQVK